MIREMFDKPWVDHPPSDAIIVPVAVANPASWRALVAAGFTQVRTGNLIGQPHRRRSTPRVPNGPAPVGRFSSSQRRNEPVIDHS